MRTCPFVSTPGEQLALAEIIRTHPELVADFTEDLAAVGQAMVPTLQGLVVTEEEAEDLLGRLVDPIVDGFLAETEGWGAEEDVRREVVGLLVRHVLGQAMADVARWLVGVKGN